MISFDLSEKKEPYRQVVAGTAPQTVDKVHDKCRGFFSY